LHYLVSGKIVFTSYNKNLQNHKGLKNKKVFLKHFFDFRIKLKPSHRSKIYYLLTNNFFLIQQKAQLLLLAGPRIKAHNRTPLY